MKEFALIFHVEPNGGAPISPAEMQERMTTWMNWMGGIAAKDRMANTGSRLGVKGSKWLGSKGLISDGPYTEVKEFINGYIIVKGKDIDEAVGLAQACPLLFGGGKVEVRPLVAPDCGE